jgi:hypothetical protein
MKWSTAFLLVVAPLLGAGAPVAQEDGNSDVPISQPTVPATGYIVSLKSGIAADASASHMAWAGDLQRRALAKRQEPEEDLKTFNLFDFQGYAGVFDAETVAEIQARDEVRRVQCFLTASDKTSRLSWLSQIFRALRVR